MGGDDLGLIPGWGWGIFIFWGGVSLTPPPVPTELQEYFGGAAPPVPAQPPLSWQSPPALLETHTAQLSARHDWEAEWGGPGLASRLPPQVRPPGWGWGGVPRVWGGFSGSPFLSLPGG